MRDAYIDELYKLTGQDRRVYSLIADNGAIVFDRYRKDFPKNFVNFGISEATMASVAAGMSSCGDIPFIYTIIPFLVMRAYEQIRNDICMQNMNVKIVGIGSGIRYSTLGPTHHALEDIALMRVLPNITVFSPADPLEIRKVTQAAYAIKGPVYIRLGTSKEPAIYKHDYKFEAGKGVLLQEGKDITLIATGDLVYDAGIAARKLKEKGVSARFINLHTLKPLDEGIILKAARETKAIITIENHSIIGGLGSAVAETLAQKSEQKVLFERIGFNDRYCWEYGDYADLKSAYGLDAEGIIKRAESLIGKVK